MANIQITQLPNAQPLTGTESVPIVQNGVTVQTTTGNIANSPVQTQTFLTVGSQPSLPNSRYFTTGADLTITDSGPLGPFSIDTNGAAKALNSLGNGFVVKTGISALVNRLFASSGAGIAVTNGDGQAGNPTVALTGLPLALANYAGVGIIAINAGLSLTPVTIGSGLVYSGTTLSTYQISGYSGSGVSGYSGYSGFSGIATSGYSGKSGYSGFSGLSGYSSDSGFSGISGYSGFSGSGVSGFSGISGYSGISGFSGFSGISGFSGLSGLPASPGAASYGEMQIVANATPITMTLQFTPYQITTGWVGNSLNGVAYSASSLVVNTAGSYLLNCTLSFTMSFSSQEILFEVYKNGSPFDAHVSTVSATIAGRNYFVSITGIYDNIGGGDVIT